MELKAKAPLDKIDKDLLDARTIALGSPTLSLQNFIDRVLADAIGDKATLPTFYDLVEEHGLIVYDKVIDGQIVPSGELLDSLRQREQQANQSFDDDSFQFWEALAKESKYSVLFDDVAMAYDRAGKSKFPWLNMDNIVDWLNIEEHVVGNAKPEAKQLDKLLIPYRKTKQSLDARLFKVTDDEIAMWVSGIDGACLDAYLVDYNGIPSKFTYDPRKFIRNDDYISPLEGLYFLPDDINRFQPAKRYISRPLLIERWAQLCDDPVNAIKHRAVDSNLFEYHPISGAVESDGKLYRSGLFDLGVVKKIESTHFPRSQLITNNSVDEQTAIVKEVINEDPKPWLTADHDEILAALFDPVPIETLAKMFSTDKLYSVGQWKTWAERASRNGLKDARQGRAKFNPYKAGKWFVHKGAEGWDDARLHRTLKSNLPARSRDDVHLLTGELD